MATKKQRAGTDIDRKPWAAYTLGHHPYALGIWHEHRWFEIASDSYDAQGASGGSPTTELRELREALHILASLPQVRGDVLEKLLKTMTRLEGTFGELAESPEMADPETSWAPGHFEWQYVVEVSARCDWPSEELRLWRELGEAVGRSQYLLVVGPDCSLREMVTVRRPN